jgi:hypothetical protein
LGKREDRLTREIEGGGVMADTLVERLQEASDDMDNRVSAYQAELLREAADKILELRNLVRILSSAYVTTSAQGDGSGE